MANMKSASQSDRDTDAREHLSKDLEAFAWRMRQIPRKPLRCDVYGTVTATVDIDHALTIFRKVFPGYRIDKMVAYTALSVLQSRLDERA